MVEAKKKAPLPYTFPIDVWVVILTHLNMPIPLPLSRPNKSALRQSDLCAAARTCKEFSIICSRLLYKNVVVDDLYLFLFSSHAPDWQAEPAKPKGITVQPLPIPKSLLFKLKPIKSLHIEYLHKTPLSTYEELIGIGGDCWATVGLISETEQMKWAKLRECQWETVSIGECILTLEKSGMKTLLPSLESISISSIYGYEADGYPMVEAEYLARGEPVHMVKGISTAFQNFLGTGAKSFKHFSQRITPGPLSIVLAQGRRPGSHPFSTYIHFGPEIGDLPLIFNQPNHWIYEGPTIDSWNPLIYKLGKCLRYLSGSIPIHSSFCGSTFTADNFVLTIHCSTSLYHRHGQNQFNALDLLFNPPRHNSPTSPITLSPFLQNAMVSKLDFEMRRILGIPQTAAGAVCASWVSSV